MNDLCVDVGYKSIIKHGEQLCGDMVQIVRDGDATILVLADGLGSGVKANILSTLTSKIIATMVAEKMPIEECVETIIKTLPVCSERGVAYSTFTIIKISNNTVAEIFQYDNPNVIMLRGGKSYDYKIDTRIIADKKILESRIELEQDDVFIAMSDGTIYAGVGRTMNYGWQRDNIVEYTEGNYSPKLSANAISALIVDACDELYGYEPGDDTTAAAVRIRKRKVVNLMFGPPSDPKLVNKMLGLFFAKQGRHIVSGGTTSSITAEYLGKQMETSIDYIDPDIPPTAKIEGVDLVTEGIITISKVLEYAKDYLADNLLFNDWHKNKDGASQISRMLFDEATDINFYIGRAVNPAHQNPDLPIGFNIKMQLADELAKALSNMGKTINVSYF